MKRFLMLFLVGINVFSQNNSVDSIQINFVVVNSTISFDNCQTIDKDFLKRKNTYKITLKDEELIQLFKIDSSKLKSINENMHFDVTVAMFEGGMKSTYCLKKSNYHTISDSEGNVFEVSNPNYVRMLNHLIYFNYKQKMVECLTDQCDKEIDDFTFLSSLLKAYEK